VRDFENLTRLTDLLNESPQHVRFARQTWRRGRQMAFSRSMLFPHRALCAQTIMGAPITLINKGRLLSFVSRQPSLGKRVLLAITCIASIPTGPRHQQATRQWLAIACTASADGWTNNSRVDVPPELLIVKVEYELLRSARYIADKRPSATRPAVHTYRA